MSMHRWSVYKEVYRLPKDKKNPRGALVRKAIAGKDQLGYIPVVMVRDGNMFYVNESDLTMVSG